MRRVKEATIPRSRDVRVEAVRTIMGGMGITGAALFIRETMSQPEDYLKIKECLFGDKTAEDVYKEIKSLDP